MGSKNFPPMYTLMSSDFCQKPLFYVSSKNCVPLSFRDVSLNKEIFLKVDPLCWRTWNFNFIVGTFLILNIKRKENTRKLKTIIIVISRSYKKNCLIHFNVKVKFLTLLFIIFMQFIFIMAILRAILVLPLCGVCYFTF